MSVSKFSPWSYVLMIDDQCVGAFSSAALAYGHWLAYAEKYNTPDAPFAHCARYRYRLDPYEAQQQDMTMVFVRQWQTIREMKQKEKK